MVRLLVRVVISIRIMVDIIVMVGGGTYRLGSNVWSLLVRPIQLITTKRLDFRLVVIRASRLYTVRVIRQAVVFTLITKTAIVKTEVIFLTILFFF